MKRVMLNWESYIWLFVQNMIGDTSQIDNDVQLVLELSKGDPFLGKKKVRLWILWRLFIYALKL